MSLTYTERAELAYHPLARRLFLLMEKKKTNLGVAVDVTRQDLLLKIAEDLGPYLVVLKTHVDILEDFDESFAKQLQFLARKHEFLIFEDRKFADIGNTTQRQYEGGVYKIASWAHLTNAHALPGPGVIEALRKVGAPLDRGLLLLAQMSSGQNLFTKEYTAATVAMAHAYSDFVIGFIAMEALVPDGPFIHMTPGVQLTCGHDLLGQTFRTPQEVIGKKGCDLLLVGRGIYEAQDPINAAISYQQAGWEAYQQRLCHV